MEVSKQSETTADADSPSSPRQVNKNISVSSKGSAFTPLDELKRNAEEELNAELLKRQNELNLLLHMQNLSRHHQMVLQQHLRHKQSLQSNNNATTQKGNTSSSSSSASSQSGGSNSSQEASSSTGVSPNQPKPTVVKSSDNSTAMKLVSMADAASLVSRPGGPSSGSSSSSPGSGSGATGSNGTTSTKQAKPRSTSSMSSSCHQCKTTKVPTRLMFCTKLPEKGKSKRKCRKKYCYACLKRSYPDMLSRISINTIHTWQ